MEPNKEYLNRLFQQYIEGNSTKEEEQLLWQWFMLLDVRTQEMMRTHEQELAIREEMRQAIMAHVQPQRKTFFLFRGSVAAAAVLLLAVSAALVFLLPDLSRKNTVAAGLVDTHNAHLKSFYLPDSTHVVLNMASSLSWTHRYNSHERRVVLSGEGYFEVHPDRKRPFIVESQGIETKALGTAFNVEAYNGETEVRVSLLHGKVAVTPVTNGLPSTLLEPGQLLRFNHAQQQMKVETISVSNSLAWMDGGMTFNRIPLTEALDRLARRYEITIMYNRNQLQHKMVSGSFHAADWKKLLPNILFVHDLKYSVRDSTITIHE